ncbi:hypothetical protein BYT27DRAFT_7226149 [Phlegmacium glaucopus]|nr:hypothetical protein BYT27DRAFT_7226149 [Phlegmacium glaucopus]
MPIPEVPQNPPLKQKTQEFIHAFPHLLDQILEREVDSQVGRDCSCLTKVWNYEQGFFVHHDIAMLRDNIASMNLGHSGNPCHSSHATNILFHIVDTNSIHQTKVRFCTCEGLVDRPGQLMHAEIFPATMKQPTTAFTFCLLHQFHLLHLEGKVSAYDFIGALRRLSDNAFPQRIPDPSPQFRMVMCVWHFLTATKRQGQAHGIDDHISHRRKGNLIVHCPSCLEPHVNMELGWERTPSNLRHLNQTQYMADGNHHSNKYSKNTDPNDVSLYNGTAYFPEDTTYQEFLRNIPNGASEKVPCDHLNVANKQNRKKFKNMDISGIVNIQCSHIFIKSTVDLQLGEKFLIVDYAIVHALQNIMREGEDVSDLIWRFIKLCDHIFSYDNVCGYSVNAVERFLEHFPKEAEFIKRTRWLIPFLHVQNHKDNCTYRFLCAYTECACHFQGETAEMTWVELNQLAPQTRQMNNGHRQDTIIDHHSHWNWMKTLNMVSQLFNDLIRTRDLFDQKHTTFKILCAVYADKISEWNSLDRHKRRLEGKEIAHFSTPVPSQSRVFQALLAELESAEPRKESLEAMTLSYLNEVILIAEEQRKVQEKVHAFKKESSDCSKSASQALSVEIEKRRDQLWKRIDTWRGIQKTIVPQIGDLVAQQAISGKAASCPEKEVLYVPSDFCERDWIKYGLVALGENQRRLLQGTACDYVSKIKTVSKTIDSGKAAKKLQEFRQRGHTRAGDEIHNIKKLQQHCINDYSATRNSMINLGMSPDNASYPPLTLKDTFRKATHSKRAVGDSRCFDGLAWTHTGVTGGSYQIPSTRAGTPAVKAKHGWIWSFRPRSGMSDKEVENWMAEGDQMERWREEWEAKQADFLRCIRSFGKMADVWQTLSTREPENCSKACERGRIAYAKQKSAMFQEMACHAKDVFRSAGYGELIDHLIDQQRGKILADFVLAERSDPKYHILELVAGVSYFN